ncbi:MAG: HIT family protein [Planctomycetota bacterium]
MTIFSKILSGEIPSHEVYSDDRVYAFLDINPLSRGHTLVIPRTPAATLGELPDDDAAALGRSLPRICRAVCEAVAADHYNVLQNNGADAGQAVFHVHFHIIPRFKGTPDAGLEMNWKPSSIDDAGSLAERIAGLISV